MSKKSDVTINPFDQLTNEKIIYRLMTLKECTIEKIQFYFSTYHYQGGTYVEVNNYEVTTKQYESDSEESYDSEVIEQSLTDFMYELVTSFVYSKVPEHYDLNNLSITVTINKGLQVEYEQQFIDEHYTQVYKG